MILVVIREQDMEDPNYIGSVIRFSIPAWNKLVNDNNIKFKVGVLPDYAVEYFKNLPTWSEKEVEIGLENGFMNSVNCHKVKKSMARICDPKKVNQEYFISETGWIN